MTQKAGPDAASMGTHVGPDVAASMWALTGLPSDSIVLVSPLGGFVGQVGAQPFGYSIPYWLIATSASSGAFSFAAFPGI